MLIRSDPPEAEIFLDGRLAGRTGPDGELAVPFEYYGTRTLVARSPGYVPTRKTVSVNPPWYQIFPLGFFTDLLWPGTIEDDHPIPLTLQRRTEAPDPTALEGAAKQFRENQERRQ